MTTLPTATPGSFYYKRNTLFTVLVYLSIFGCIGGFFYSFQYYEKAEQILFEIVMNIFVLAWNVKILKDKDFFFRGNLTKKCSPWLYIAAARVLVGIVYTTISVDTYSMGSFFSAACTACIFACYRYWSFFRPWKQVQHNPIYMLQQQIMTGAHQMMQQPHVMMMPQQYAPPQYDNTQYATPQYVAPQPFPANPVYYKS